MRVHKCQCADPGCPVHDGRSRCNRNATTTMYRIEVEDETGTPMCDGCALDASESGVFADGDDSDEDFDDFDPENIYNLPSMRQSVEEDRARRSR